MLEGFENKYSDWTTSRTVSYTNLKPGTYNFVVMTKNADGVVSGASGIKIVKLPYVWQNFWFMFLTIILVLLVSVLLVSFGIKLRIKKIAESERKSL